MMGILVSSGPHDLLVDHGFDVAEHDEDPQEEKHDSHSRSNELYGGTVEPNAKLDGRNRESHVRKDVRIPIEMEIVSRNGFNACDDGNAKTPEGKDPEEDGGKEGKELHDVWDEALVGDTIQ